ncbi:hypothetical protein HK096_009314, partial [Nowakowskiella sp. JEL0078]
MEKWGALLQAANINIENKEKTQANTLNAQNTTKEKKMRRHGQPTRSEAGEVSGVPSHLVFEFKVDVPNEDSSTTQKKRRGNDPKASIDNLTQPNPNLFSRSTNLSSIIAESQSATILSHGYQNPNSISNAFIHRSNQLSSGYSSRQQSPNSPILYFNNQILQDQFESSSTNVKKHLQKLKPGYSSALKIYNTQQPFNVFGISSDQQNAVNQSEPSSGVAISPNKSFYSEFCSRDTTATHSPVNMLTSPSLMIQQLSTNNAYRWSDKLCQQSEVPKSPQTLMHLQSPFMDFAMLSNSAIKDEQSSETTSPAEVIIAGDLNDDSLKRRKHSCLHPGCGRAFTT